MAQITQEKYDAIPWQEVESSNIIRVAYKPTGTDATSDQPIGELYIEFGSSEGRAYRYINVQQVLFDDLLHAASIGGFFARNIRGRYEHERLEVGDDEDA
jgi:KTSC domain